MSEWTYTAVNAAFALICCWQASKATDARIVASLHESNTQRWHIWAREDAEEVRKIRRAMLPR